MNNNRRVLFDILIFIVELGMSGFEESGEAAKMKICVPVITAFWKGIYKKCFMF